MLSKKRRHASTAKGTWTKTSGANQQTITVTLVCLGVKPRRLKIRQATTLREVVRAEGCSELSIRVNRHPMAPAACLRDGDAIVAIPRAIVGGAGAFGQLALEPYRQRLSPGDYRFLAKFVGAEALGFKQDDLYSS